MKSVPLGLQFCCPPMPLSWLCARVSSFWLIRNSASQVLTLLYMNQATAGVFTPWKLANDAATDQSWLFFLESRGLGTGLHMLSACPCSVPTCLPFLKRSRVFKHVCCIFAFHYDIFFFISAHSIWFFSKLAVSFSLMISCPLQDLSILRFISLNEVSLADLLDLLSI